MTRPRNAGTAPPSPAQPRVGPLRAKAKLLGSENFPAVQSTAWVWTEPAAEANGLAYRRTD